MPYDSHINLTFRGIQGGQICSTELDFVAETAVSGNYAELIADEAYFSIWNEWQQHASEHFTLLDIKAQTIDTIAGVGFSHTWFREVNEPGDIVGNVMPPNVTVRFRKVPNNNTIEPSGATHFKNGFFGLSGVPEADQDNGLLTPTAFAAWDSLSAPVAEMQITFGATVYTWFLGMHRGELNPDKVIVDGVNLSQRLGTRNSRKR